ncbi:MAG TPA: SDR family NAD(P)-dependent oxidoreductase [Chakrabartia sp.]|jgi:NAD(P)-dependent dehydrogenase (short-subunit alcohol dehydrogenase family)|nr:SDR family NAD(P)-dependent oxidoreductase [Chakrabartia sp.]
MKFAGKSVVITGGATGIGLALATQIGSRGAQITLFEPRSDVLAEAVAGLEAKGIPAHGFTGDVTERTSLEALADYAWDVAGPVDAVIANAGVGGLRQSVLDFDLEAAKRLTEVNYWGVWQTLQVFGQRFRDSGRASALYATASENSLFNAYPFGGGAYLASKHAVFGLMDMLRREAPANIETGVILPGWTATPMTRNMGMPADEFAARIVDQMEAGEYYLVGHSYNAVRMEERWSEVREAFAKWAPREDGDEQYDVRLFFERLQAEKAKG